MTVTSRIRRPRTAQPVSLTAPQVARAYNYPADATGRGTTIGIIELGGAYLPSDLAAYCQMLNLPQPTVTTTGTQTPDPQGADGEVALDVQVAVAVAPGARQRVYFAANTDEGFATAIGQAVADGCTVISISWGQAEDQWSTTAIAAMEKQFLAAKAAGIVVTVAAGDSGADDGTGRPVTDYPASSPNVLACGGTRLELTTSGARALETTWDDNDTSSATGGGVSAVFTGRQVPDVAGNADPDTGYEIVLHGQRAVVGGTSAVAPLYAALVCLLSEALGEPLGRAVDLENTLLTNPGVCWDVVSGDNGAYRAGPGRDNVTGLGVVDGTRLLAVLDDATADPAPVTTAPPTSGLIARYFTADDIAKLDKWAARRTSSPSASAAWKDGRLSATSATAALAVAHAAGHGGRHYHDAATGRYVTPDYAETHPDTTYGSQS